MMPQPPGPAAGFPKVLSPRNYLRRTTWLLTAAVIAMTLVSLRYPPRLGSDFAQLLAGWEHFRRTGEFNRTVSPDPADIAHDLKSTITWWSPGPAVAAGAFEYAGLPVGVGLSFWLGAATVAQLWGLRKLYVDLGFASSTITSALIVVAAGWHTLYSFRLFQGGDLFAAALFPWAGLVMLRLQPRPIATMLVLSALVLFGGLIKLSFVVTILALAVAGGLAAVWQETITTRSVALTAWRHGWPLALGGTVGWILLQALFLSKGVTPASAWPVEYTVGSLLHALGMSLVLPLWSIFSLVSLSGRLLDAVGIRHLEENSVMLATAVLVCSFIYFAVWRSLTTRRTRILLLGFGVVYVLAFTKFYFTGAAISYEDRLFRPLGLLLLPAIVAYAEQGVSRMLRAFLWTLLGLGTFWGPASYAWNLCDLIRHDNISERRYSLTTLPATVEQTLRRLDLALPDGNNLFHVATIDAELAIGHNRTATFDVNAVPGPLRGRVDNLVVLLPTETPARPWLSRFADYREQEWNRYSTAGWTFYWQGKQIRLPSERL